MRQRLRYRLSRLIASGGWGPFGLLAVVALAIVFAGAVAINNQASIDLDFWGSVRWSLSHVLNPGAFVGDLEAAWPVVTVGVIVSLSGMALFGTLISFIAAGIQKRIDRFESGPALEEGHTLILGWSYKTPLVVRGLLRLGSNDAIVILAGQSVQSMRSILRAEGLVRETRRLVIRTGDPSNRYDLSQVSANQANVVIVASPEDDHGLDVGADIAVVETLMVLTSELDGDNRTSPVSVVGEIAAKDKLEIAEIAGQGEASLICTAETVGRLTAQIVRQPGLASVVAKLFEAPGGPITVRPMGQHAGKSMKELSSAIRGAAPIGVTWQTGSGDRKRAAAALNLEPDYQVDDDEQLVFLSTRRETRLKKAPPALVESRNTEVSEEPSRLLVLGHNDMRDEVLHQLDKQLSQRLEVTLIDSRGLTETSSDTGSAYRWLDLEHRRGSIVDRDTLSAAHPESYDCVLVLSDEERAATDPDAFTVMTLLLLDDIRRAAPQAPWSRIVAELYDHQTVAMLPPQLADTLIVQPQIVSTMLAQIARQPILAPVYRELLSADGMEIVLRPAADYAKLGAPTTYADICAVARLKLETVIGIRAFGSEGAEVSIAPDPTDEWALTERDRIILLAQRVFI